MHSVVAGRPSVWARSLESIMRALMNLAIEPALRLFEVSTLVVITPSQQAVKRVLRVMADTPLGAIHIVRDRYPRSRAHEVLSCRMLDASQAA
jgi:hypothetical protein